METERYKLSEPRARLVLTILLFISSLLFAQQQDQLRSALSDLCVFIRDLVPLTAMLMITSAAAVYAGGQLMGAETRARANVWATSMLTGALVGILIVIIVPAVLGIMLGLNGPITC
ncbi:MAG: hypothetical protein QXW70_02485 [Candidatus Anstonellales archaeon]